MRSSTIRMSGGSIWARISGCKVMGASCADLIRASRRMMHSGKCGRGWPGQARPRRRGRLRPDPEIAFENIRIDRRQRLNVRDRDALVHHMHGRADETEFHHRTIAADETGIRCSARRRKFWLAARVPFDGGCDEVGEFVGFRDEGGRIAGFERKTITRVAPRRRRSAARSRRSKSRASSDR